MVGFLDWSIELRMPLNRVLGRGWHVFLWYSNMVRR